MNAKDTTIAALRTLRDELSIEYKRIQAEHHQVLEAAQQLLDKKRSVAERINSISAAIGVINEVAS